MTTTLLTKDDILAVCDLRTEDVDVPEWGGSVRVRTLTGSERDAFDQASMNRRTRGGGVDVRGIKVRFIALSVIDENGKRVFDDDPKTLAALQGKSAAALDRIWTVASKLSGLTEDDAKELAGNSDGAPNDSSGSD